MNNIVIAIPDIYSFKIDDSHDYILMGCDGIYENLSNKELFESVLSTFEDETPVTLFTSNKTLFSSKIKSDSMKTQMGLVIDSIMRSCFKSLSSDNLSLILICFKGFSQIWEKTSKELETKADKLKSLKSGNILRYLMKEGDGKEKEKEKNSSVYYKRRGNSNLIG